MGTTRAVAGGTVGAAQQAGVALSASATSSAISYAGHQALAGTAWAATGAPTNSYSAQEGTIERTIQSIYNTLRNTLYIKICHFVF